MRKLAYRPWPLVLAITVFLTLVWTAASQKSETVDEGLFIAEGVAQVRTLNPNFDVSHPPLLRWLAGISSIVLGGAVLPSDPPPVTPVAAIPLVQYKQEPDFDFAERFFYSPGVDHEKVLFWGRFPFALLAVATAVLLFREIRKFYGAAIATISTVVFLFTPEILAHSQWAHSDVAAAFATLIVALALARSAESVTRGGDAALGAALGFAMLAKITSAALVPLAVAVLIYFHLRSKHSTRKLLTRLVMIGAISWVVLIVGYLPQPRLAPHEFDANDISLIVHSAPESQIVSTTLAILRVTPLPDGFLKGLVYTKVLSDRGQVSYFHGEVRTRGWWYYYPTALFLKYPTPLLLLAIVGLIASARSEVLGSARKVAWIAPPLTMFALTTTNRVNIGARALLPLAPFFALWCASALWLAWPRKQVRAAALVVAGLSIISGIAAYPNFLAYFNPLLGGTRAADKWLIDSNLDWGQDLPSLSKALRKRNVRQVHLAFFGAGNPGHYGISYIPIIEREPGWYAVSRSYLSGWWPPGDPYRWLRERVPEEFVGGSIALIKVDSGSLANTDSSSTSPSPALSGDVTMGRALDLLYKQRNPGAAIPIFDSILNQNPHHYGAMWQLAFALDELGRTNEALSAWERVVQEAESSGYSEGVEHARGRLDFLRGK